MNFEDVVKITKAVKRKASETKKKIVSFLDENQLEIFLGTALGFGMVGTLLGYANLYEIVKMKKTDEDCDYVELWDKDNGWWIRFSSKIPRFSDEKMVEMLKANRESDKSITEFFAESHIPFDVVSPEKK